MREADLRWDGCSIGRADSECVAPGAAFLREPPPAHDPGNRRALPCLPSRRGTHDLTHTAIVMTVFGSEREARAGR